MFIVSSSTSALLSINSVENVGWSVRVASFFCEHIENSVYASPDFSIRCATRSDQYATSVRAELRTCESTHVR